MVGHATFLVPFLSVLVLVASCAVPRDPRPPREAELWGSADKGRPVCGSGAYLHGIDVSKWQGTIDWVRLAASGTVDFAFIRSSYGRYGVDSAFDANWAASRAVGIPRGAYHYFNPAYEGAPQADAMLMQFDDPTDLGELPLVLDAEERDGAPPPAEYAARIEDFVRTLAARTGRTPAIYTGGGFWDAYVKTDGLATLPVWVAHYFGDRSTRHCPSTPDAWPRWTFWQHSEMGTVAGITGSVDLDVFDGTMDELLALTGRSDASPADAGLDAMHADAGASAGCGDGGACAPASPHEAGCSVARTPTSAGGMPLALVVVVTSCAAARVRRRGARARRSPCRCRP